MAGALFQQPHAENKRRAFGHAWVLPTTFWEIPRPWCGRFEFTMIDALGISTLTDLDGVSNFSAFSVHRTDLNDPAFSRAATPADRHKRHVTSPTQSILIL